VPDRQIQPGPPLSGGKLARFAAARRDSVLSAFAGLRLRHGSLRSGLRATQNRLRRPQGAPISGVARGRRNAVDSATQGGSKANSVG
jgi:hypothetical protein